MSIPRFLVLTYFSPLIKPVSNNSPCQIPLNKPTKSTTTSTHVSYYLTRLLKRLTINTLVKCYLTRSVGRPSLNRIAVTKIYCRFLLRKVLYCTKKQACQVLLDKIIKTVCSIYPCQVVLDKTILIYS